jgi:hypothetical protein
MIIVQIHQEIEEGKNRVNLDQIEFSLFPIWFAPRVYQTLHTHPRVDGSGFNSYSYS